MYLKVILAPVFTSQKLRPEEAFKYLEHLDEKHQKVFITKGLAFLMPRKVTKMLLPKDYYENNPIIENKKIKDDYFLSDMDDSSTETVKIVKDGKASNLVSLPKQPNSVALKQISQFDDLTNDSKVYGVKNKLSFKEKVQTKSRVLLSSQLMKNLQSMPGRIDPLWDNMGEYEKRKRNNQLRKEASTGKLNVLNLIMNLKSFHLEKKISKQTAYTGGGISLFLFVFQLIVSRNARRWTRKMIMLSIYFSGFSVLAFSAGYITYLKMSEKKKQNHGNRKPNSPLQITEEHPSDLSQH